MQMRGWMYKSMGDGALMAAYAKGQPLAFEYLYLRHKASVFCFLRRQCHRDEIAEELAHDTWIGVINQAVNYRSEAKFKTWIFRIAHNRLVDYWRKYGASPHCLFDELTEQISDGEDTTPRDAEIRELFNHLKILPQNQIETLLLKIEGFSHSEIAEITATGRETVKTRLRYATRHLRRRMEVQV